MKKEQPNERSLSILWLVQNLGEAIQKLDEGTLSPKEANAKAQLANAMTRAAAVLLAYERLRSQSQIKKVIPLLSDDEE
jgi:hypothetical protein